MAPPRAHRWPRVLGFVALGVVGALALTVILLALAPVRNVVLSQAVRQAKARLPGDLVIEKAAWPSFNSIDLAGVLWTQNGDTLAAADTLTLVMDLRSLFNRDLHARRVVATGVTFDLPALRAAFPSSNKPVASSTPRKERSFPRRGVFPKIPSLAADVVVLRIDRARFGESWTLIASELEGGVDLSPERGPWLELTRLVARTAERSMAVEVTPFNLDGRKKTVSGDLSAQLDSLGTLVVHVASYGDSLDLLITLNPDAEGAPVRATLRGLPTWQDQRFQAFDFGGDIEIPETADLAAWPKLHRVVSRLAPLPALSLHTTGRLTLRPKFGIQAQIACPSRGWLERLELAGSYGGSGIAVDTLEVGLPGLRLSASGTQEQSSLDGRARARITDGRWLAVVIPGFDPPESLAADLRVVANGRQGERDVRVLLEGGYRKKNVTLSDVKITGHFPAGIKNPGVVDVTAVSRELRATTRAELIPRMPLFATLSPVRLEDLRYSHRARAVTPRSPGTVGYDPKTRKLQVKSVQVIGDWGAGQLSGALTNGVGNAVVACQFEGPPAILRRALASADSTWMALHERWEADGPFTLETRVQFRKGQISADGNCRLPGPATLRAFLPSGSRVDDLGALSAHFAGSLDSMWAVDLDLSSTPWLDTAPIRLEGSRSRIGVDSLGLSLDDTHISIAGGRRDGLWDASGTLQISNGDLLGRFVPSWTQRDSSALRVTARLRGTQPDLSFTLKGGGRFHEIVLGSVTGTASRVDGRWTANVRAGDLVFGTAIRLDRVLAGFATMDGDSGVAPERIDLECSGPDIALLLRGTVHRGDGFRVVADTMGIAAGGKDLRSLRSFEVHALAQKQGFVLEDLDLKGSMGTVVGKGDLRPGASHLDLRANLDLAGLPVPPGWRPELWPDHAELSVRNEGASDVYAQVSLTGLSLGGPGDYTITGTARGDGTGLKANVEARGAGASLKAEAFAPGTWQLYPVRVRFVPNQLQSHVTVDSLPVPWDLLGMEAGQIWPATLSGVMHMDHDDHGPFARADLDVTFVSPEENARTIRFTTHGAWMANAGQTSRLEGAGAPLDPALASRLSGLSEPGCVVTFALSRTSAPELVGTLSAPFQKTPEGRYVLDRERGIDLLASTERLDLSSLNAFLPPGNALSGTVKLDLSVKGPLSNPNVGGQLDTGDFTVTTRDGGRVLGKGKLTCSGTLLAPRVEGRVDIKNALIQIPEEPRKLHPVSGPALLWPGRTAALPDTLPAGANHGEELADSVTTRRFAPAYDLEINVPSGAWIRGRNLNVELGGDLRLQQESGHPTVVGTLEARQGTLIFLGRSFTLEHGKVQFYGEDENNPNLDIRLEAKVSSTDVYITMTGTAREPEVELTSSPSMNEADIMSLLVMGKTTEDLDGDQAALVAQRAAAVAATYGAAELEKKMAGPLGVDMITLNPGGGPEGESSVIVGKYLSPKALLKYEQALDSAAGFFVTLQYTLTETITLETIAGTWQSGGEISWSKDY